MYCYKRIIIVCNSRWEGTLSPQVFEHTYKHLYICMHIHTYHTVRQYCKLWIMEVWVFLDKKSPKNQLYNTILVPWQYWLGITKHKSAFSATLNAFNRLLQKVCLMEFSTACLPACPLSSRPCLGMK